MVECLTVSLEEQVICSYLSGPTIAAKPRELSHNLGIKPAHLRAALERLQRSQRVVTSGSGKLFLLASRDAVLPHVAVADPPWPHDDQCPGKGRGARKHYRTLAVEQIKTFRLPPLHPDAWLFLWRVASMPEEALEVVRVWGFVPKSEIVWIKRDPGGRCNPGMGHYVRCTHETCIIAARGKAIPLRLSKRIPSFFEAARPLKPGTNKPLHSAKPEKFFDMVERLVRGPYVELFARRQREGWDCYGRAIGREVSV
jgi:N6-adenosine-specific RNA methylase IME4